MVRWRHCVCDVCLPAEQLYGQLVPLLELGSDTLQVAFAISQAYVLLAPELFLARYGATLVANCRSLLPEMKPEGVVMVLRLVETALRAAPQTGATRPDPIRPDPGTQSLHRSLHVLPP